MEAGIDLIGTVHIDLDLIHFIRIEHLETEAFQMFGRTDRARNTGRNLLAGGGQRVDKEINGRTCTNAENPAFLNKRHRALRGCLLQLILIHRKYRFFVGGCIAGSHFNSQGLKLLGEPALKRYPARKARRR